jgi:hypothetical protein
LRPVIRFLEHKEIDPAKWDACIENSPASLPYGFSWFLDIVAESWCGLVLDDYKAVMPLPYKQRLGIRYIYQPFFTQQLGVFCKDEAADFLAAIPKSFIRVHTNLNWKNTSTKYKKELSAETNLVLDLDLPFGKIKAGFSENCRRNLKKAQKGDLRIEACKAAELIKIFQSTKGKEIAHLKEENYSTLEKLVKTFEKKRIAEVTGVFDPEKNLLGGAVFLRHKNRNIFFFSALTEKGKELSILNFLLMNFIESKAGTKELLDFEGSNKPSLARFYRGFGATEQNYSSFKTDRLPALVKPALRQLRNIVRGKKQ